MYFTVKFAIFSFLESSNENSLRPQRRVSWDSDENLDFLARIMEGRLREKLSQGLDSR